MKRFLMRCWLFVLAVVLGSCTRFGMFEDVGSDPHPPLVELVGVAYTPVATPEDATEPDPGTETDTVTEAEPATPEPPKLPPPDFKPGDGFEIKINDPLTTSLVMRVRYQDAGGDIVSFQLRDRDSTFISTGMPVAPTIDLNGDGVPDTVPTPDFFSGTSGTVDLVGITFSPTMLGAHRMELWAEDGHGSRSPKVSFTFNVVIAPR